VLFVPAAGAGEGMDMRVEPEVRVEGLDDRDKAGRKPGLAAAADMSSATVS